jgi:hypothetical protein
MGRAALFGVLVAQGAALAYGILADPVGLSWGLIAAGIVGGWLVARAVKSGAWSGRFHLIVPRVRWLAALIAVVAWIEAVLVGYVGSQIFYQGPQTPLLERLSLNGFLEYLNSSVFSPSILALAAMAFVAWRSAR